MVFITTVGIALKRIVRAETLALSIWVVLTSLVIVAAASLYYAIQLPAHVEEERVLLAYEQRGLYEYTVHLKPNTVYGVTELGAQETYFAALVESVEMASDYSLTGRSSTGEILSLPDEGAIEYEVVAVLKEGDLWQREYILVPRSLTSNHHIETRFHLPIQTYQEEAEAVLAEVQTPGRDLRLQVEARFWPLVTTTQGTIDTPFVHSMTFLWEGAELKVSGSSSAASTDALTESISVSNPQRDLYVRLAILGLALSLFLWAIWAVVSRWAAHTPYSAAELQIESRRLYGEQLVEAVALPPPLPNQVVVSLRSLDDVGRAARELMRPIVVVSERGVYRYVVIDGEDSVRYEYQIRIESEPNQSTPDDDARTKQEPWQPSTASHRNGHTGAPSPSPAPDEVEANNRTDATAIQRIPVQAFQGSSTTPPTNHNHHLP